MMAPLFLASTALHFRVTARPRHARAARVFSARSISAEVA